MKKVQKGEFGYIHYRRITQTVFTVLLFALSISIFLMGYYTTHTKKNLLTIVAILGCLPASKNAVNMIMFYIADSCSDALHDKIVRAVGQLDGFYDLFFTAEKQNFQVSHLVVTQTSIIGITESSKTDENEFEKHIKNILNKDKISGITVKLFRDADKYCRRLEELNQSEEVQAKRDDIVSTLYHVSL